jgi:hypothetical protein
VGETRTTSTAYTPTLLVAAETTIRRERRLPLPGEVRVAVGDRVAAEQVVAATALPGRVSAVNVARELNLPPGEIEKWVLKKPGDAVEYNEPLAEYKSFFGFFRSQALSPAAGTLEAISAVTGQALIRGPSLPVELKAYLSGTVVETHADEAVTIECTCALVQGILGVGGEAYGGLVILARSPEETLLPAALTPEHAGKIVVGGANLDWAVLERAREVGVSALVVGAMQAADLDRLLGAPLGVAITGHESLGLTVVLTEGFGSIPMAGETYDLLSAHAGDQASLNGATQIRAGVLRPEVIVPLREKSGRETPPASGRLEIGSRVRMVREPYFGLLGSVTGLPPEPQTIPTEATVRVLLARLDSGEEVTVPRANVELIER